MALLYSGIFSFNRTTMEAGLPLRGGESRKIRGLFFVHYSFKNKTIGSITWKAPLIRHKQ